jgi:8-amino-7-oxononanoate synthase
MSSFEEHLKARLDEIAQAGLERRLRRVDSPQGVHLRVQGRDLLNFSSNDYLGLANHPALRKAAREAVETFGAGSGASRLICGSLSVHHELEETLAEFKATPAALTFSSGYSAAIGTLGACVGRNDIVILDKRVHACVVDAARLSGAKLRVFRHNDLNDLETILKWAAARPAVGGARPRVVIVTESVFSMDGDLAPLREMVELKERHGAWLMLDEAHATGVFGPRGKGLAQHCGVADQIEIQMGTLGKALGAAGGYVCGSRALIDLLINRARSFIFSTAPGPAPVAAAIAGLALAGSSEGDARRERLWKRVSEFPSGFGCGSDAGTGGSSPIRPWIIGEESRAMEVAERLRNAGIFAPAIRFPTVARGSARLRFTLTADHSAEDIGKLCQCLETAITDTAS